MRDASSGDKLKIALFGELSFEEAMNLSRDRQILELETEFLLNNIYKFSSYLTGNTLRHHYKAQPVNAVWGNSHGFFENHTEHTDTLCGSISK
jgi:hypothetical protein